MTITGDLKSQVDNIWNNFHSGGVSNPLSVIEQITNLLFLKRLEDLDRTKTLQAKHSSNMEWDSIYPDEGDFNADEKDATPFRHLKWSYMLSFSNAKGRMDLMDQSFAYLRALSEDRPTFSHLQDTRLGFTAAPLLTKVMAGLDELPTDGDKKGDIYEYMLGKIATAGTNGQFRTPRHIIQLMVHLMAPKPGDVICDPAAGTCGFLMEAAKYLETAHPEVLTDPDQKAHFDTNMFYGFEFDPTMLRIGNMNMILHGVEGAQVVYRDSLTEDDHNDAGKYSLILANPPFAGSLDYDATAKHLSTAVKTKKTELLFMAQILHLLTKGGRAAVIVPDGVMFGSSKAHQEIRKLLVEDHKLEAVIKLPSGVFKPYAGVSTAIVIFTKTTVGGTDKVWFYNMEQDGFSLDDKRTPALDEDKLGPVPNVQLSDAELLKNNLPDVMNRWNLRTTTEAERPKTAQSFLVSKEDIIASGSYDLSLNRYKEIEHEEIHYDSPLQIIAELEALEAEINQGLKELKEMLA